MDSKPKPKPKPKQTPKRRSLAEFARSEGCWLCYIPERKEIEQAKTGGTETSVIVKWLIDDCGYAQELVMGKRSGFSSHFLNHIGKKP